MFILIFAELEIKVGVFYMLLSYIPFKAMLIQKGRIIFYANPSLQRFP